MGIFNDYWTLNLSETICKKHQSLYLVKIRRKILKCRLLKYLPSMLSGEDEISLSIDFTVNIYMTSKRKYKIEIDSFDLISYLRSKS